MTRKPRKPFSSPDNRSPNAVSTREPPPPRRSSGDAETPWKPVASLILPRDEGSRSSLARSQVLRGPADPPKTRPQERAPVLALGASGSGGEAPGATDGVGGRSGWGSGTGHPALRPTGAPL